LWFAHSSNFNTGNTISKSSMAEIAQGTRSLREGIISLAAVQAAEYLIPLIALPYLLRVLGPEEFGKIAFAQAFCMYFVALTEYGFNLTGTRLIAIHRHDKEATSRIFWEVQFVKAAFFLLSITSLLILIVAFAKLQNIAPVLLIGLLPVIGSVMYPLWLLQGLERMREAAGLMISARALMLVGVFAFVTNGKDMLLAAALQFAAVPVAGMMSWIMLIRSGQITWVRPTRVGLMASLREGWHTFVATAASTLYRSSNAVVLGLLSGPAAVTFYALAEKIVKAVQELNRPISQAVYPRVSALAAQSKEAALPLLRKILFSIGGLSMIASFTLFFAAGAIIRVIAGHGYEEAALALRFMAFIPLVGSINSVLGAQMMLPFGFSRAFSRFVVAAGIFNLAAIVPLVMWLTSRGAALSFFFSELLLMILMATFLHKQGFTRRFSPIDG
jgi:O-antigen/teichoic acid export membrane protein